MLAELTMSPQEQRLAIAKVHGYKMRSWTDRKGNLCQGWDAPNGEKNVMGPPFYLNDLNGMHAVEKLLSNEQYWAYTELLQKLVHLKREEYVADRASATATQRAEAFLRTLNLWKDS